ncbi:MAG: DUF2478 domain-containing protein [Rhizobiaceae bacterium]
MIRASGIAAIGFSGQQTVDHIFREIADQLKTDGLSVAGYVQKEIQQPGSCCSTIFVEDIASGALQCISQPLGPGSRGCRLDTAAMAVAECSLLAQVNSKTNLIIINRFGKGEAEGGGLRAVIGAAALRNIPILVGVRDAYFQDWIEFAGDEFSTLSADTRVALQWCRSALKSSTEESIIEAPIPNLKHEVV